MIDAFVYNSCFYCIGIVKNKTTKIVVYDAMRTFGPNVSYAVGICQSCFNETWRNNGVSRNPGLWSDVKESMCMWKWNRRKWAQDIHIIHQNAYPWE